MPTFPSAARAAFEGRGNVTDSRFHSGLKHDSDSGLGHHMSGEINPSAVTADVLAQLIKTAFSSIAQNSSAAIRSAWQKVFEDFEPYAQQTHKKTSFVRILCDKKNDVPLYDVYVGGNFTSNQHRLSDEGVIQHIVEGNNIIINGSGGAGKTFFMKHLWQTIFRNPKGLLPIFVDLRALNEVKTSLDLKSFLRITIGSRGHLSEELFDYFCTNGRFCFILDGFDELRDDIREGVQGQILGMAEKFTKCSFVVSSRQHQRFAGWQGFRVFDSDPFSYEKVLELIGKVPFNTDYKKTFQRHLTEKFYNEHRHFLSNPLLCVMMLMTFKENMTIPKNMNVFYDQAFNTLFVWHDATKAFSRQKSMDIDEFRRSFGVFCLLSYYNQVHEFSAVQLIEYIKLSNKVLGSELNEVDIKKEYVESVNMLQEEGLGYVFIHRSFQEYFAAYAMMNVVGSKMVEFIKVFKGRPADNVMPIAYEMDKTTIIEKYVIPEYATCFRAISRRVLSKSPYRQLREVGLVLSMSIQSITSDEPSRVALRNFGLYYMVEMNISIRNFVNTVFRIMGDVEMQDIQSSFFKIAQTVMGFYEPTKGKRHMAPKPYRVAIRFADSRWIIESDGFSATSSERLAQIEGELERSLAKNEAEVLACANEFKRKLDLARDWCDEQIKENKNRNRSLTDILGFDELAS